MKKRDLKLGLIISPQEYEDLIELANDSGTPLKTLIMKTMNQLASENKEQKANWNKMHN